MKRKRTSEQDSTGRQAQSKRARLEPQVVATTAVTPVRLATASLSSRQIIDVSAVPGRIDELRTNIATTPVASKSKKVKPKVDPVTGQPSEVANATPYSTYYHNIMVDPVTGKPSDADNGITRKQYYSNKMVDPVTGKPSEADDAILYTKYNNSKRVDPVTGRLSKANNAIPRSTFSDNVMVDPVTGKPSKAGNAIPRSKYRRDKKLGLVIGAPSEAANAILDVTYNSKKYRQRQRDRQNQDYQASGLPISTTTTTTTTSSIEEEVYALPQISLLTNPISLTEDGEPVVEVINIVSAFSGATSAITFFSLPPIQVSDEDPVSNDSIVDLLNDALSEGSEEVTAMDVEPDLGSQTIVSGSEPENEPDVPSSASFVSLLSGVTSAITFFTLAPIQVSDQEPVSSDSIEDFLNDELGDGIRDDEPMLAGIYQKP
jgi:hypothetical protein